MNAVWEKFCADLLEVGKVLEDEIVPQDPLTRAEGVRYLSRLLRYGTINCVEYTTVAAVLVRSEPEHDDEDRCRQPGQRLHACQHLR
jgi:hypothetical protein